MENYNTLLTNAASSIKCGIEDYQSNSQERLGSAIRNIYAGILLIFKEKLRLLSPDGSNNVLLKENIIPKMTNGCIIFVGKENKKTVKLHQIVERFEHLGIKADFGSLAAIIKIRNNIEHYHLDAKEKEHSLRNVRKALARCAGIIDSFLTAELSTTPRDLLGDTWNTLIQIQEVYESERADTLADFKRIAAHSDNLLSALLQYGCCPHCDSDLIRVSGNDLMEQDTVTCRSCSKSSNIEEIASEAIHSLLDNGYLVGTDGDDPNLQECPNCHNETYIVEDDSCPICKYERDYTACNICGTHLSIDEQDLDGLCAYHYHLVNKDD